MGQAAVAQRQTLVAQRAHRREAALVLGKRKGGALKFGQRAPEGFALLDVLPGFIDRGLGRSDALERDQKPAQIEALHHLGEALAQLAHHRRGGQFDVVEEHRTTPHRAAADIVEAGAGDARKIERHQKGGHAARPGCRDRCARTAASSRPERRS